MANPHFYNLGKNLLQIGKKNAKFRKGKPPNIGGILAPKKSLSHTTIQIVCVCNKHVYNVIVCALCNYDKAIPWNELTSVRTTTEQHSSLLFFLHRTTILEEE